MTGTSLGLVEFVNGVTRHSELSIPPDESISPGQMRPKSNSNSKVVGEQAQIVSPSCAFVDRMASDDSSNTDFQDDISRIFLVLQIFYVCV